MQRRKKKKVALKNGLCLLCFRVFFHKMKLFLNHCSQRDLYLGCCDPLHSGYLQHIFIASRTLTCALFYIRVQEVWSRRPVQQFRSPLETTIKHSLRPPLHYGAFSCDCVGEPRSARALALQSNRSGIAPLLPLAGASALKKPQPKRRAGHL